MLLFLLRLANKKEDGDNKGEVEEELVEWPLLVEEFEDDDEGVEEEEAEAE